MVRFPQVVDRHPRINLRALDRCMPEHLLQMPYWRTGSRHVRRARVSKAMRGNWLSQSRHRAVLLDHQADGVGLHGIAVLGEEKMVIAIRTTPIDP